MFYRKNLPGWERAVRVIAGVVMIVWGLLAFPAASPGYAIAAGGVTAILTGLVGFCPMCAMVGRAPPSR
ncbi:YgaP family membrane protein [Bradyrhizobium sp.]|uniref:YgaP family membrane protein n=1 Tax=Bradyrhizobium sp. TaxID=376 RepID=UPI004037BD2C